MVRLAYLLRGSELKVNQVGKAVVRQIVQGGKYVASTESLETIPGELVRQLLTGQYGKVAGPIISVRGVTILGDVNLSHLDWSGGLELAACDIQGDLILSHAKIKGRISLEDSKVATLALDYAEIEGGLFGKRLQAIRGVFALGARISGALALQDSILQAPPEGERRNRAALDTYRASIGDVFLNRATLNGGFYGIGMTVTRNLRLAGASVSSRRSMGLDQGPDAGDGIALAGASVGGSIYLWTAASGPVQINGGSISLSNASSSRLWVSVEQLDSLAISMDGYKYRTIAPATGNEMLRALDRANPFPRNAYTELARYAEALGEEDLKRRALIHQQRRVSKGSKAFTLTGARRRMFGLLVNYGYSPSRALIGLAICIASASSVLHWHGNFIQSKSGFELLHSWPQAIALSTDYLLPFSVLDFRAQWIVSPVGPSQWSWFLILSIVKIASWALAALALASATGLIRRR